MDQNKNEDIYGTIDPRHVAKLRTLSNADALATLGGQLPEARIRHIPGTTRGEGTYVFAVNKVFPSRVLLPLALPAAIRS